MTTIVNATSAVEMHVAASENISKGHAIIGLFSPRAHSPTELGPRQYTKTLRLVFAH